MNDDTTNKVSSDASELALVDGAGVDAEDTPEDATEVAGADGAEDDAEVALEEAVGEDAQGAPRMTMPLTAPPAKPLSMALQMASRTLSSVGMGSSTWASLSGSMPIPSLPSWPEEVLMHCQVM